MSQGFVHTIMNRKPQKLSSTILTPSFSCPNRTSPPWRHPTSARYCQLIHLGLEQHVDAHSEIVVASLNGFKSPGHFPRRSSFVFHGELEQGGI